MRAPLPAPPGRRAGVAPLTLLVAALASSCGPTLRFTPLGPVGDPLPLGAPVDVVPTGGVPPAELDPVGRLEASGYESNEAATRAMIARAREVGGNALVEHACARAGECTARVARYRR